MTFSEKL